MSNLNESAQSFEHLISNKFLKQSPSFIEKYYFVEKLLIVEY